MFDGFGVYKHRLRHQVWNLRLTLIRIAWNCFEFIPRSAERRQIFFLKRADFNFKSYLSTESLVFFNCALEDLDYCLRKHRDAPYTNTVQLSGWAASTSEKVRSIEIVSALETLNIKPRIKRSDVAAFYGSKKLLRSGFKVCVKVLDQNETVHIKVIANSDYSCGLTINKIAEGVVSNHSEPTLLVGSVDECSRTKQSGISLLALKANLSDANLMNLSEVLIAMSRYEDAESFIHLLNHIPFGVDRRLDRARYAVNSEHNSEHQSVFEVLRSEQLDAGALDKKPQAECVIANDVLVYSGSLLVNNRNKFLIADRAARPDFDFVSGQWELAIGSRTRLNEVQVPRRPPPNEQIDQAVSLLGRNAENYFHSLIEYLPRYFTAKDSGLLTQHLFLLNSESPATIKFAAESLIPPDLIRYVSKQDVLQVRELLVPTFHTQTYDSTNIPWEFSGKMDWRPIKQFAERMIELHLGPEQRQNDFFAIRSGGLRSIPNADRLIRIAQDEGFEILDLSKLTFVEQLNRLYWSRRAVIPGGAGLAGMIFMRPENSVLTLATEEQKELGTYRALARKADVQLQYLLGTPTIAPGQAAFRMNEIHSPFIISPKHFKKTLQEM